MQHPCSALFFPSRCVTLVRPSSQEGRQELAQSSVSVSVLTITAKTGNNNWDTCGVVLEEEAQQ